MPFQPAAKPQSWATPGGLVTPEWRSLRSRVVAAYLFQEGGGTAVHDVSGHGMHGTSANSPPWAITPSGLSLDFDGSSQRVDLPGDALEIPLPLTLFGLFSLNGGQNWGSVIGTDYLDNYFGASMYVTPSEIVELFVGDGGTPTASNRRTKTGTTVLNDKQVYFVVGVIRGLTDMDIYIDGVDDGGTLGGTGGPLVHSSDPGVIGARNPSTFFFKGKIILAGVLRGNTTSGEVRAWARDPFAPFRIWRPSSASVIAAAAAARRIFITGG